jgi:hypothetical protein
MKEADPYQNAAAENDGIGNIARILRTLSADMVRVVAVEARLFGHTALTMVVLCLVIALLLVGGWLFAAAALVMALASLQAFNLAGALLTVALAHLVLAALAFWRLRYITRDLTFRESRASVNSVLTHARSLVDDVAGRRPPPQ